MEKQVQTEVAPLPKPERKAWPYNPQVAAIHRLRVNVKSLAAEAKIIRQEGKRCGMQYEYELTLHRKGRLREEARLAQLALTYARCQPHSKAENKNSKPVSVEELTTKLMRARVPISMPVAEWLKS